MTHTNRALAELHYSFHCSYCKTHTFFFPVLFPSPLPGRRAAARRERSDVTGLSPRRGDGDPPPALPPPFVPEPRRAGANSRHPHPRLTLPGRGGARRGAQSPYCGHRRKGQPPPRRSPAPSRPGAARYSLLQSLRLGWPLSARGDAGQDGGTAPAGSSARRGRARRGAAAARPPLKP